MIGPIGFANISRRESGGLMARAFASIAAAVFAAGWALQAGVQAQELRLTNPTGFDRSPEVVEVPIAQVLVHLRTSPQELRSLVAIDTANGQRIPSQLYSDKPGGNPDTLLLYVQLRANNRDEISLRFDPAAPSQEPLVFGRDAPERKDDFAWENRVVTYRIYGPALEATGEITSGIDVWSKRVPNFVIDSFYKRDLEGARTHNPAFSYHKDNGQGLDSYLVGPTRGCGGTAVFADGKLFASKNYTLMHMLSDGPIRFAFEVSYAPWDANGITVRERKRITLDAGTHLNRIESWYTFDGPKTLDLAAGIAVHAGATPEFPVADGVASVWDTPQLESAGRIATGMVAAPSQHAMTRESNGHALMIFARHSGKPFVYYAGAGWSKADMPTAASWNVYLRTQLRQLEHPIKVQWISKPHHGTVH